MIHNQGPIVNILTDAQLNQSTCDSRGILPFVKFGHNKDIDTGTETVWDFGGTWVPMTGSAAKLWISSSNVNDISTGSGARSISIQGVGEGRVDQSETISLNGTSLVTSSYTWLGINRVLITSVGTTGSANLGGITLIEQSGSTVQAYISGSDGITHQVIYHTPVGNTFYVRRIVCVVDKISGGGTQPQVEINGYIIYPNNVRIEVLNDSLEPGQRNSFDSLLTVDFPVPGGSYFYINATTDQNNTYVRCRVEGSLVKNL